MEQVQESIFLQPSVLVLEEQKVSCPITHNSCSLATECWLSHQVLQHQSHPAACWWPSHTTATGVIHMLWKIKDRSNS